MAKRPPETEAAAVNDSAPKPKSKFKKILILGVLGLFLIGGGWRPMFSCRMSPRPGRKPKPARLPRKHAADMPLERFWWSGRTGKTRRYRN